MLFIIVLVLFSPVLEGSLGGLNCNNNNVKLSSLTNKYDDSHFHYGIVCLKVTDFTCASVDAWENLYLSGSVKTCSYFKQEDQEHVLDKNGHGQMIINRVNWAGANYFYVEKDKRLGLVMTKDTIAATGSSVDLTAHFTYLEMGGTTMICYNNVSNAVTTVTSVTGSYYCKVTATCTELNRPCVGALVMRTGTLAFTNDTAEPSETREIVNDFLFLKKTSLKTLLKCVGTNPEWYQNAAAIATGETSYEYTHTTGKDTVIQCITDTKAYTWNIFTVADPEQTKKNDKTIVRGGEKKVFACPALTTVVFPTCTQVWYHKSVDEGAEYKSIAIDTKLAVTVTSVTHTIEEASTTQDGGHYRCQHVNGKVPETTDYQQDSDVIFDTENTIRSLEPSNKVENWYEFDVTRREAYYMSRDVILLECNVTMAENATLWWNFGDAEWYNGSNPQRAPAKWTLTHEVEDKKVGHNQTFTAEKTLLDIDNNENTTMYAFIVMSVNDENGDIVFTNSTEQGKYIKHRQSLLVRTFKGSAVAPLVGGPGGYVMPERTSTITLRCSDHTGIPPPHVSWLFKNYAVNITTNLTHELMQVKKQDRLNKFKETRIKDRESEMEIIGGVAEDSGWYWCQMRNRNSMDEGNLGTTNFTDIPCDEEDFWCPNGCTRDWMVLWQMGAVVVVVWLS